jgi:hypothetical protein
VSYELNKWIRIISQSLEVSGADLKTIDLIKTKLIKTIRNYEIMYENKNE